MLLIFPFAYLLSFFLSLRGLWQKKTNAIFIYVIAGLPIYNTALSIVYGYKLKSWIVCVFNLSKVFNKSPFLL